LSHQSKFVFPELFPNRSTSDSFSEFVAHAED
jgi:hypothetical protein